MTEPYDLVVIGAGSGGVRAARMSAGYGARVAIVEADRVGGTCVIRGCVPKKLLVYGARFSDLFDLARSYGWQVDARFDWPTLIANKDEEIARLEAAYVRTLQNAGTEIIHDRAILESATSIVLKGSGRRLEARNLLIATGGHPFVPDIPGAGLGFTSDDAFRLARLPHSVLIEGGGYVAAEFATIFAGLGVKTTIVYRGDLMLRGFDQDLRVGLDTALKDRGIEIIYQTNVDLLERAPNGDVAVSFSDGLTIPYGGVMFATGRRPSVSGFGLEALDIALTANGGIAVDQFGRTSQPNIFAVGDVTGRIALTPLAIRDGAAIAETLFNDNPTTVDRSLVPSAVFADPEVATIGLTEAEAATHGDIDVYVARFRPMINTMSTRTERVMLKLIALAGDGKVVGCHILGAGAAEMIQLVAIPMAMGATKADFDRAIAVHPTSAEELVTMKAPAYVYRGGRRP